MKVMEVDEAAKAGDFVMMLVPDELAADIYAEKVAPNLVEGNVLMFAHGFNIHFNQIKAPERCRRYHGGAQRPRPHRAQPVFGRQRRAEPDRGLSGCFRPRQGLSRWPMLAASARGRAGILETTFKEETETDLFGEQAVLCGGVTELMKAGFDTLVEAGYEPEMAYFECIHEMKLIVDLINSGGFAMMRYSISNTAEYGDYRTGRRLITEDTRKEMKQVLREIQDGTFASEFIQEFRSGRQAKFLATRRMEAEHPLEKVGGELREMMSWLKK